jgi:hypothetical protein
MLCSQAQQSRPTLACKVKRPVSGNRHSPALYRSSRATVRTAQATDEAGESRVVGGIHFQFDNTAGLAAGRALGNYITENFLLPVSQEDDGGGDGAFLSSRAGQHGKAPESMRSDLPWLAALERTGHTGDSLSVRQSPASSATPPRGFKPTVITVSPARPQFSTAPPVKAKTARGGENGSPLADWAQSPFRHALE